jgi:hypothetical protein
LASDTLSGGGTVLGGTPSHLYWTSNFTVWSANLDGTSPHSLLATDSNGPLGVAADSAHVYWATNGDGTIWAADLDGNNPQICAARCSGHACPDCRACSQLWAASCVAAAICPSASSA